jgi:hypothetical protein
MKRHGEKIVVVALVKMIGQHQLLGVVHATDALRLGLRLGERGEEHRRQNRDDRNHHKQFNESEPTTDLAVGGPDRQRAVLGAGAGLHNFAVPFNQFAVRIGLRLLTPTAHCQRRDSPFIFYTKTP